MVEVVLLVVGIALGGVIAWVLVQRERARGEDGILTERFASMRDDLDRVAGLVQQLESNRATSYGRLEEQLRQTGERTSELATSAQALRQALASPQTRGAWGERMAADVLRHAGMVEGINFHVHQTLDGGSRPDFTFPLPGDRVLHMDVKFPLDNYLKALEADEHGDTDVAVRYRRAFLKDVRARVKEITTRSYVDPEAGTLDYVLLFLPNEHVYGYVHEHDPGLLDEAMRHKVVLCSPLTLFAVLAVVRETVDNFALEQASRQVLDLLGGFRGEWDRFTDAFDKLGRRLEGAARDYESLVGVRARGIERQLDRIDEVRSRAVRTEDGGGPSGTVHPTVTSTYERDRRGEAA